MVQPPGTFLPDYLFPNRSSSVKRASCYHLKVKTLHDRLPLFSFFTWPNSGWAQFTFHTDP